MQMFQLFRSFSCPPAAAEVKFVADTPIIQSPSTAAGEVHLVADIHGKFQMPLAVDNKVRLAPGVALLQAACVCLVLCTYIA